MLKEKCTAYLDFLCNKIDSRRVGSKGNIASTDYCKEIFESFGWNTEMTALDVIDWQENGAILSIDGEEFDVLPSPYSVGCDVKGELIKISNIEELEKADLSNKIVFFHGQIAKEQLMPKSFVFYNPKEHQKIIAFLEEKRPLAIISATGRNAALAGGVYPFPLIEDGDFDIPSVYTTEEVGEVIAKKTGMIAQLVSEARRIPSKAYNVIGKKGKNPAQRVVVTAHIDAKMGTPGAIDNATGVIVLLLLAELMKDYNGEKMIELVAFNGEDYYSVPGQMAFVAKNQDKFDQIELNINIDGAGLKNSKSAISFYDLPDNFQANARETIEKFDGLVKGAQWPQGDHSIFLQFGCPAIAVSSEWFIEHVDNQDITHTPKDKPEIVDCDRVVEIAKGLAYFLQQLDQV
ncbi:MAG: M28 family metallopeptidase [Candidatus Zixiibacteriota bacterium]